MASSSAHGIYEQNVCPHCSAFLPIKVAAGGLAPGHPYIRASIESVNNATNLKSYIIHSAKIVIITIHFRYYLGCPQPPHH